MFFNGESSKIAVLFIFAKQLKLAFLLCVIVLAWQINWMTNHFIISKQFIKIILLSQRITIQQTSSNYQRVVNVIVLMLSSQTLSFRSH